MSRCNVTSFHHFRYKRIGFFFQPVQNLLPGAFTIFTHFGGVTQNELLNAASELVFTLLLFGREKLLCDFGLGCFSLFKKTRMLFALLSGLCQ
ncbi:hypothetical protein D3C76_1445830 [compost metagenome]